MTTLSQHYQANKSQIQNNWKLEHIKEKYNHDVVKYCLGVLAHAEKNSTHITPEPTFGYKDLAQSLFIWAIGCKEVFGDNVKIRQLWALTK
jgi:hypothetical protein